MTNEEAKNWLNRLYIGADITDEYGDMEDMQPYSEAFDMAIEALEQTRWIPVSKQLPKENEYIEDVCKYYLIQDEYGDMHVAHLSNVGWIPMDSLKAIGNEIVAWQELPQPYKGERG